MTSRPPKKFAVLFLVIGIYAAFPWMNGYIFLQYMKIKHGVVIQGNWIPSYFPLGRFHIYHLHANWKERFQILSGELEVRYNPFLLSASKGNVSFSGHELEVSMKKEIGKLNVKGPFFVRQFHAELELMPGAEPFIHSLEIDSPVIQFKISGN